MGEVMPLDANADNVPQEPGSIITPRMEQAGAAVLAQFPQWAKTRPATLARNVFVAMMREYDPGDEPAEPIGEAF